jgi:hypothetical protein
LGEIAEITSKKVLKGWSLNACRWQREFAETPDQFKDFYRKNKATVDVLDRDWNEQYEKLREGFVN